MDTPPPVRAPKSQLAIEQPSTEGCWNLPKKYTPHPKTKIKPQWDSRRCANTIKSNPIPPRGATHKLENNNTKEVLPLLWRFRASHQASQPRDLAKRLGIPRESDTEGQQDLITGFLQDWGKTETPLVEDTKSSCAHQDPGERSSDLTEDWIRPLC